jgi:hypothetical protein
MHIEFFMRGKISGCKCSCSTTGHIIQTRDAWFRETRDRWLVVLEPGERVGSNLSGQAIYYYLHTGLARLSMQKDDTVRCGSRKSSRYLGGQSRSTDGGSPATSLAAVDRFAPPTAREGCEASAAMDASYSCPSIVVFGHSSRSRDSELKSSTSRMVKSLSTYPTLSKPVVPARQNLGLAAPC